MHDVFVSHVAKDSAVAIKMATCLEAEGYSTWYFERDAVVGRPYPIQDIEAIKTSKALLLVISRDSLNSPEVASELYTALGSSKHIIPLLLGISYEQMSESKPDWEHILAFAVTLQIVGEGEEARRSILKALTELDVVPDENEAAGLLRAMGFEIAAVMRRERSFLFRAQRMMTYGFLHRWYLYHEKAVTVDDVRLIKNKVASDPGSDGWVVTDFTIDVDARKLIGEDDRLSVHKLADFFRLTLDYDRYLKELSEGSAEGQSESEPEIRMINGRWVDLCCSVGDSGRFSLIEYVDDWLDRADRFGRGPANQLAVLGDFGLGKTWFCRYYAARLAKRHIAEPNRHRIPILIPLRGCSEPMNVRRFITQTLQDRYHFDLLGGFDTLMYLNRRGRLLLLLDGFDEMERSVEKNVALQNLTELLSTVAERSKVILTSRQLFFDEKDLATILSGDAGKASFDTLHLRLFEEDQIKEALSKRVPVGHAGCWGLISSAELLRQTASRPVMTEIICEALCAIAQLGPTVEGAAPNRTELYRDTIVNNWIVKACKGDAKLIGKRDGVLLFIRDLAWESAAPDGRIDPSELRRRAGECFHSPSLTRALEMLFVYDCGRYAFPHASLLDYFVAERIAGDLALGDSASLFSGRTNVGVMSFLADLARPRPDVISGILAALRVAEPKEQIGAVMKLLAELGSGNPLKPIEALARQGREILDLPRHVIDELAEETWIDELGSRAVSNQPPPVSMFLIELMSSARVNSERAIKMLTEAISDQDADRRVRQHAVKSLAARNEPENNSLIDALHGVVENDHDDLDFRLECVTRLILLGSARALHPLVPILKDFNHVLWQRTANFISDVAVSSVADEIEAQAITPHEEIEQLIQKTVTLKQAVRKIREKAKAMSRPNEGKQGETR